MNKLPIEKQVRVISALVEGNSIRSIERMLHVNRNTVLRILERTGEHCARMLDTYMRDIHCDSLELDELWTYVGKKERRVTWRDNRQAVGDFYVFTSIDPATKLMPWFTVGKRDTDTAWQFLAQLNARVKRNGRPIDITSDGFPAYQLVIGNTYGNDCTYTQIQKSYESEHIGRGRYAPPRVSFVQKAVFWGRPDFDKLGTSIIERSNLTARMHMRRFTRLTNGFSKKFDNLLHALNLHFAWYNFCRVHRTIKTTPAVKAGVAPGILSLETLIPQDVRGN